MAASVGHPEDSRTTFISDLGSQSIQRIIFLSSPSFFFNFSVIEARGGVCIDLFIQGDLRGPALRCQGHIVTTGALLTAFPEETKDLVALYD